MEAVREDDFPCLDCPQRFSEYHKYKLHARKQFILVTKGGPESVWTPDIPCRSIFRGYGLMIPAYEIITVDE